MCASLLFMASYYFFLLDTIAKGVMFVLFRFIDDRFKSKATKMSNV